MGYANISKNSSLSIFRISGSRGCWLTGSSIFHFLRNHTHCLSAKAVLDLILQPVSMRLESVRILLYTCYFGGFFLQLCHPTFFNGYEVRSHWWFWCSFLWWLITLKIFSYALLGYFYEIISFNLVIKNFEFVSWIWVRFQKN